MSTLIRSPKALAVAVILLLSFPLIIPASNQLAAPVGITIYFGRAGCSEGFGICRIEMASRGAASSGVLRMQGQTAMIDFSQMPKEKSDTIFIDEDLTVPVEVARKLGCGNGCTLVKGEYRVNYSRNQNGTVEGVQLRAANP
ncbi:MAG TPA: hypothetical protein VGC91_07290 [Pyrinomonadaceae bacterium]|jgi:hypothetical protein